MATLKDLAAQLGLKLDVMLIPASALNMPTQRVNGKIDFVPLAPLRKWTIHETDNTSIGANAMMHRNFVANGGGGEHVSFMFTVDDEHAIQIMPDHAQQWAQGTDEGNATSASVETCVNRDGDKARTRDNLAKLTAAYLVAYNLPLAAVVQHNAWYGKDCPMQLRHEPGAWDALVAKIAGYVQQLTAPPVATSTELNGFTISGPFYAAWRKGGVDLFGLPLTAVVPMDFPGLGTLQIQWFERARIELHPDNSITLGRVGAEALAAQKGAS